MKAYKSEQGKTEVIAYYNLLLEKLTTPYEQLDLKTSFGNTHILIAGNPDAPPLVLLHGSSMNSSMWIGDMMKYCNHFRVYAPDLPGEPGQSDENQLPFTTHDYDNWLLETLTALDIKQSTLIGASLGAWLAAKFAISHPEIVNNLVLLCPAGIGTQNKSFLFTALFYIMLGDKGINKLIEKINGGPIPQVIVDYQKILIKHFNSRKEPIPIFTDEELQRLTMPISLYVGSKDIILRSKETADRMKRLLPHTNINILPEAGHSIAGQADDILQVII